MVAIGNFFFHYRNALFPVFYFFLFLPAPRISQNYLLIFVSGLTITLIGQAIRMGTIGLVYIIRGGKNRRIYAEDLVTDGIFAHCRNPMYVGNLIMILGMSLLSNSWFALALMFPLFAFIYQSIVLAEENFLRNKFGEDFDQYTRDVPRWLPRFRGLGKTLSGYTFDWKKVIYKEYNTTYVWTIGAVLLLAYNRFYAKSIGDFSSIVSFAMAIIILTITYLAIRFMKKRARRLGQQI